MRLGHWCLRTCSWAADSTQGMLMESKGNGSSCFAEETSWTLISAKNFGKQIRHVYLNHAMRSMGIFKMCDASLYLWWTLSTEYLLFVRIRY